MARRGKNEPETNTGGPTSAETKISRQIDLLKETSDRERSKVLKENWAQTAEQLYNLTESLSPAPSFRPKVQVPELQFQMLAEASDLSDTQPRVYIVRKGKSERDKAREEAFRAQWSHGEYNLQFLMGIVWSLFTGNGYIQVGYDPDAWDGEGEVTMTSRHPATVYPDPFARCDKDLQYVIFEDEMYIDEVRRMWPEQGWRVRQSRPQPTSPSSTRLSLPPGPMQMTGSLPIGQDSNAMMYSSTRVVVNKAFVKDYSVLRSEKDLNKDNKEPLWIPSTMPAYPNGRFIAECEGIILADLAYPLPYFPIATIHGMPPLTSFFAPPPVSYTVDLQTLAERMMTQTYENAIRTNNGITYVEENTTIDLEEFGGVPGEVHMIAAGSKPPTTVWPQSLPSQMVELPEKLLALQKEIQGFTPGRKGMTTPGNVSAPLYDASIMQSQSVTRLRSKFLAVALQRAAEIVFATMGKFYTNKRDFPMFMGEDYRPIEWAPLGEFDPTEFKLKVDRASIRPYSATSQRMMIPMLRQMGVIDAQSALETLEIPNVEDIMKRLAKEAQQKAQTEAMKPKRGGKK